MTRILLSLAVFVFFALCVYGMWHGWKRRQREQAGLPAFPSTPETLGAARLETTGVYIGTTNAGNWQDRVQVGDIGFRAEATLSLVPEGVAIERVGASPIFIPAGSIRGARTDRGLAGKVMFSEEGLLVVQWENDGHLFDTGFRGDDKDVYDEWVAALVGGKA
ncbi:PH-like domain-containing protein [Lentzea cavernae]|uniref:Transporter n=1 Tax=Lentzea cavernae TaxID=2020703 RepID=A0ABQ3MV13_9PSEU|nr:transporter [Lentzea cavernae]GHH58476.1 transporter [Lentzea cavernae]